MLNMTMTAEAAARLKALLDNEGDDMCIRLRETQVGTPCKRQIVLRLSIDEREEDDLECEINGLPFVTVQDLVDQYGENFTVTLDENQMPVVAAAH